MTLYHLDSVVPKVQKWEEFDSHPLTLHMYHHKMVVLHMC